MYFIIYHLRRNYFVILSGKKGSVCNCDTNFGAWSCCNNSVQKKEKVPIVDEKPTFITKLLYLSNNDVIQIPCEICL